MINVDSIYKMYETKLMKREFFKSGLFFCTFPDQVQLLIALINTNLKPIKLNNWQQHLNVIYPPKKDKPNRTEYNFKLTLPRYFSEHELRDYYDPKLNPKSEILMRTGKSKIPRKTANLNAV